MFEEKSLILLNTKMIMYWCKQINILPFSLDGAFSNGGKLLNSYSMFFCVMLFLL